MLRLSGWVVVVALSALLAPRLAAEEPAAFSEEIPELFPAGEPEEAPASPDPLGLPRPSIREPFSIGEALYNPARVPLAVVSLLDLMAVPIVANQAAADAAARPTLSEAEVRTLIDMGVEDAKAAARSEESAPPYSFADLHKLLTPYLPGLTVGELAEAYAQAYEPRPDDLVPKLLMGQPLALETPLSRVQIWLLLVDGLVGTNRPAALQASGGAMAERLERWREEDRNWSRNVVHVPLAASRNRVVATPAPTAAAPGRVSRLKLRLVNNYNVALDFGALGNTRRRGAEGIRGDLELQPDGTYRGDVLARSYSLHIGYSPLKECGLGFSRGSQRLLVTATPGAELTRYQSTTRIQVIEGQIDGGLVSLRFEPLTDPVFTTRDDCQDADDLLRPGASGAANFLPFNDARWWTPEHTFVLRTPLQGKLVYVDASLAGPPSSTLGPTSAVIKGTDTHLTIEVERIEVP